jgi:hypothetical protein
MSFPAITLCVASQRVFIVDDVYFVIDSVRKILDIHSYACLKHVVSEFREFHFRTVYVCLFVHPYNLLVSRTCGNADVTKAWSHTSSPPQYEIVSRSFRTESITI